MACIRVPTTNNAGIKPKWTEHRILPRLNSSSTHTRVRLPTVLPNLCQQLVLCQHNAELTAWLFFSTWFCGLVSHRRISSTLESRTSTLHIHLSESSFLFTKPFHCYNRSTFLFFNRILCEQIETIWCAHHALLMRSSNLKASSLKPPTTREQGNNVFWITSRSLFTFKMS